MCVSSGSAPPLLKSSPLSVCVVPPLFISVSLPCVCARALLFVARPTWQRRSGCWRSVCLTLCLNVCVVTGTTRTAGREEQGLAEMKHEVLEMESVLNIH